MEADSSKDAHVYRLRERRPYCTGVIDALAVVASYVLASISFPYWIARAKGIDLRAFGSRKLGGSHLPEAAKSPHRVPGGTPRRAEGFAAVTAPHAPRRPPDSPVPATL